MKTDHMVHTRSCIDDAYSMWCVLDWSPYSQSAKILDFRKIHWKFIFEYIIGARKQNASIDILNMCIFDFGLPGNYCTNDDQRVEEVGCLRWPTSGTVLKSQIQ